MLVLQSSTYSISATSPDILPKLLNVIGMLDTCTQSLQIRLALGQPKHAAVEAYRKPVSKPFVIAGLLYAGETSHIGSLVGYKMVIAESSRIEHNTSFFPQASGISGPATPDNFYTPYPLREGSFLHDGNRCQPSNVLSRRQNQS
jgi:hypothetical protein